MIPSTVKIHTEVGVITPGDVIWLFPDQTIALNDEYANGILREDIESGLWHKHGYALDPDDSIRFGKYKHNMSDDNACVSYIFKSNPEWDVTGKDRKCIIDLWHVDFQTGDEAHVGCYEFIIENGCTNIEYFYKRNLFVIKPHISDQSTNIMYICVNRIRIRA